MTRRPKETSDSDMLPIPKGMLFTVTKGAYSDYAVHGVFRARQDIDTLSLKSQWLADHPDVYDARGESICNEHTFLAWLAGMNLIEQIQCMEWFLSCYDDPSDMTVTKIDGLV